MKCEDMSVSLEMDKSLPVRGAWVEIIQGSTHKERESVAPRAGSVG